MMGDMPTIIDTGHAHSTYSLANMAVPIGIVAGTTASGGLGNWPGLMQQQFAAGEIVQTNVPPKPVPKQNNARNKEVTMSRRLVQVFIADPDDNVPLEASLLYSGEQKLTDATDQELFFEIDMQSILKAHNDERVKLVNKKIKERVEHLEPVKIRDLKMVVVNVATF